MKESFNLNVDGKERLFAFESSHQQTAFFENGKFLFTIDGNIMDLEISQKQWNQRFFKNLKAYDKNKSLNAERHAQVEQNQFFNQLLIVHPCSSLKRQENESNIQKQKCKPFLWIKSLFDTLSEL